MSTAPQGQPSSPARHYWAGGDDARQLTMLSDDYLYVAEGLKMKELRAGVDALLQGRSPREIFPNATIIPLAAVTAVETVEHRAEVKVRYEAAGKVKTLDVATDIAGEKGDAFERLAEALGPNVQRTEQPLPAGQAIVAPSIALVVVVAATVVLYLAAAAIDPDEEYNPTGRRRAFKMLAHWLLETLGPTGVVIAGSAALLLSAFWLYRRITNPPRQTIVTPVV